MGYSEATAVRLVSLKEGGKGMKGEKQERAGKLPGGREVGARRGSRYRNRRAEEGGVRRGGGGRGRGKEREEENRQKVRRVILDYRQGIVRARGRRRETEEATGPVPSSESTVGCLLVDQVSG